MDMLKPNNDYTFNLFHSKLKLNLATSVHYNISTHVLRMLCISFCNTYRPF